VIAESFERIHRANLVGLGVLPLQFMPGEGVAALGLTGQETLSIAGLGELKPRQEVAITIGRPDGTETRTAAMVRLDTPVDVKYYRNGGILQTVLRNMLRDQG
jgi:aconitate hydratase